MWETIEKAIEETEGDRFEILDRSSIGGGCINDAQRLDGADSSYFVKTNDASFLPLFEAEADALREIAASKTIRVPNPICHGLANESQAFLVLEYIEIGSGGASSQQHLGECLARMHQTRMPHYGWNRDNAIGSTPQPNQPEQDWAIFFRDQRLRFQFELAEMEAAGAGGQ